MTRRQDDTEETPQFILDNKQIGQAPQADFD